MSSRLRLGLAGCVGLDLALLQPRRLADQLAHVVELGPPHPAGALHLDLGDLRRVDRGDALDALALDDPADRERLADAAALAGDDDAGEDLDALLGAFEDALVHLDLVADLELRDLVFDRRRLDQLKKPILHRFPPPGPPTGPMVRRPAGDGCGLRIVRGASGRWPRDCR